MNIAKLTSSDLPLFNGITQDLFPAVETPNIDYGKVSWTRLTVTHSGRKQVFLLSLHDSVPILFYLSDKCQ